MKVPEYDDVIVKVTICRRIKASGFWRFLFMILMDIPIIGYSILVGLLL